MKKPITICAVAKDILEFTHPYEGTWNEMDALVMLDFTLDLLKESKNASWARILLDLVSDVFQATHGEISFSVEECLASVREFVAEEVGGASDLAKPALLAA